jgi:hypothetical protein
MSLRSNRWRAAVANGFLPSAEALEYPARVVPEYVDESAVLIWRLLTPSVDLRIAVSGWRYEQVEWQAKGQVRM